MNNNITIYNNLQLPNAKTHPFVKLFHDLNLLLKRDYNNTRPLTLKSISAEWHLIDFNCTENYLLFYKSTNPSLVFLAHEFTYLSNGIVKQWKRIPSAVEVLRSWRQR